VPAFFAYTILQPFFIQVEVNVMDDSGARRLTRWPGESLADVRIEDLNLEPVTQMYLKRASINTVADLTSKTERMVGLIPGIGPFKLQEIKDKLQDCGLCLCAGYHGEWPRISPISWLMDELGTDICWHLERQGIKMIGDLLTYSEEQIEAFPQIGPYSRDKIVRVLAAHNLYLREE
jgi:DNA-directed RNA polymerase alpha subunit